jgi:PIN domain nuclease of toxin-antitoxin system
VAEPAVVTDTHPLIFHASGARALGRRAARLFAAATARQAIVYVPAVVMWETSLLILAGRVDLRPSFAEFFERLFQNPAFQPLPLTPQEVVLAHERRPNRDPFDALVCAAATRLGLPLVTRDSDITDSGLVPVMW